MATPNNLIGSSSTTNGVLGKDGTWMRRSPGDDPPRNAQRELMLGHSSRAAES